MRLIDKGLRSLFSARVRCLSWRDIARAALAIQLVFFVGACGTLTNPGAPEQSFDIDQDIQNLERIFKENGPTIDSFYKNPTAARRNEFIAYRLALTNIQYIKFIRQFALEKAQWDSAIDITTLGVDLAVTLAGGESVKAILGAISAGLTGSKITIDKNFYYEKTVPVLVTAMNATRKEALLPILKGTREELDEYAFSDALSDLHNYYQAGTFIGALNAIQKESGEREQQADADLAAVRDAAFVTREAQQRVDSNLDLADSLPVGAAWDILQRPPSALDDFTADAVRLRLGGTNLQDATNLLGSVDGNDDASVANDANAKLILRMILVLIADRSEENLGKWTAAMKALIEPG